MSEPVYLLRWENPPATIENGWRAPRAPQQLIRERFAELRLHPKRWGVVYEGVDKQRVSMMAARFKRQHPGFEVVSRRTSEGRAVYARYTG